MMETNASMFIINKFIHKYVGYVFAIALFCFMAINLRSEPLYNMDQISIVSSGRIQKITKLRPDLLTIFHQYQNKLPIKSNSSTQSIYNNNQQLILVDAVAKDDPRVLLNDLLTLGLQYPDIFERIISGFLPLAAVDKLDALESLNEVKLSKIITAQGAISSQGDRSQKSDIARKSFDVNGDGITIGVISDSFNCLKGASIDNQNKDLPENILIIEDALDCSGKKDEGRALMQIIHDIAPGAKLIFHSGANGIAKTANAIMALAFTHKASIIVDDHKSLSANYFQDDALSQAVNRVVRSGVVYVTAAGNSARNSYQSSYAEYINIASQINAHDFDPGQNVDIFQRIAVPEGVGFLICLQWDSPAYSISGPPGAQTDLDIFILNETHTEVMASATYGNIGRDPVEILYFLNPEGSGQNQFDLMITKPYGSSPSVLKYIILNSIGGIIQEYGTSSSAIFGHANTKRALTVGAASYAETPEFGLPQPLLQSFSSAGGTPILFESDGSVLINPYIPKKPDVVAPDNVNNSFFGLDTDNDGLPNILGTSAAAPHAAGVVALLLEINPELQPIDIKKIIQSTSIDILQRNDGYQIYNGIGFDFDSGYGLIDAHAAVELARNYAASDPEGTIINDIVIRDPNKMGGGGKMGLLEIAAFLLCLIITRLIEFTSKRTRFSLSRIR